MNLLHGILLMYSFQLIGSIKLKYIHLFCKTMSLNTISHISSSSPSSLQSIKNQTEILSTCPDELKIFLGKRIYSSLQSTWPELSESDRLETSSTIVKNIISSVPIPLPNNSSSDNQNAKKYRKQISEKGLHISHILELPGTKQKLKSLFSAGESVDSTENVIDGSDMRSHINNLHNIQLLVDEFNKHKELNFNIFHNITSHHHQLINKLKENNTITMDSLLTENDLNLVGYASAATQMGQKSWVLNGNMWLQTTMIDYFKNDGSKKLFLKNIRSKIHSNLTNQNNNTASIPMSILNENQAGNINGGKQFIITNGSILKAYPQYLPIFDWFQKHLKSEDVSTKLKVVDVGSCYNPFSKGVYNSHFDVTALDLCPTDDSVFTCDFLKLQFGSSDSIPITAPLSTMPSSSNNNINNDNIININNKINNLALIQLPEYSYDAVTVSLVLCYLPTPQSRLDMVRQARRLLKTPPLPITDIITAIDNTISSSSSSSSSSDADIQHTSNSTSGINNNINKISIDSRLEQLPCDIHKSGIFILFEKQSIFDRSKYFHHFIAHWKRVICSVGFQYVRYSAVIDPHTGKMSHGFIFKATHSNDDISDSGHTCNDSSSSNSSSSNSGSYSGGDGSSSSVKDEEAVAVAASGDERASRYRAIDTAMDGLWIKHDFDSVDSVDNADTSASASTIAAATAADNVYDDHDYEDEDEEED